MKQVLLFLLCVVGIQAVAQENRSYDKFIRPNDSILFINLPRLTLPESYKSARGKDLPDYHNNADNPYFRPIINQYGWSCGQAASIGYGFTYELNRVREVSALEAENQYPPLYTFNYFNQGEDGVGVCYLYTLDAIKQNGNPNVVDYGGMGESLKHWTTGYDTYYNGMSNKIEEVYALDVGDEEGLLTLKHYLYDHLEGSDIGGIVNFYTDLGTITTLPEGTPEEGKAVITAFGAYTGHAMTFIGWNDSVRYDYNSDGQYTNDLDINEDGEVTMKDWEVGGLILANTWGNDWADSGFCYVMYNVIAQEKLDGGVWNKQVNTIKVKEEYEPMLTFMVQLTHDSRNKIRVVAGVAKDTTRCFPEYTLEFPIFSYQGGNHYMQGTDTNSTYKTLEFGLDVTPLLSYISPGEPGKFFLQVHENDGNHFYTGKVNYFSIMDYTNGSLEIPSPETDVPLLENDYTFVFVVHSLSWDNIEIENDELPAYTSGQPYSHQMTATGGTEPYAWEIAPIYSHIEYIDDYPNIIGGGDITPGDDHSGFVRLPLDFEFPFYDRLSDTIFMYVDGFLSLDSINYPYPYTVDNMLHFKNEQIISAFYNGEIFMSNQPANGMWYEGDETYASFRWVATIIVDGVWCPLDLSVTLFPDGNIDIFIDTYIFPMDVGKITGVSNGDGLNFEIAGEPIGGYSWSPKKISFSPLNFPCESSIDDTGLLSFNPIDENNIYNLSVRVTDDNRISNIKSFQISNGLIYDYVINSGDNNQIDYGETAFLDFTLKNSGNTDLNNVEMKIETSDPFINVLDDNEFAGDIPSGSSVDLEDAISFELLQGIPNNYHFLVKVILSSDENSWEGRMSLTAYAPVVKMGTPRIEDGNDNRLEPGESAQMIIPLTNSGFSPAEGVEGSIYTPDTLISLDPAGGTIQYGTIVPGQTMNDTIGIFVAEDAPQGHVLNFEANIQVEPDIEITDTFDLLIGRYPALVVDLDPEILSGPYIKFALEDLDVPHSYMMYLPNDLDDYQNLFVVLGRQFGQHVLSDSEGQRLAEFLDDGGNIYMEGGLTWYDDPPTVVHPKFYINTEYVNWNEMDSVFGAEASFLDNLQFDYLGDAMYYNYRLLPAYLSYPILHNASEEHNYAIAYPGEEYKTVGSTLDFGALVNGSPPNTRNYLLAKILEFFDVDIIISGIENRSDGIATQNLSLFPNPISGDFTVRFNLEKSQEASVFIYDIHGKQVMTLVEHEHFASGEHEISGNVKGLLPGVYICTLKTASSTGSIKLIISR